MEPAPDLFALDAHVDALERHLAELARNARLEVLVALAWHLRQRRCMQALLLADEAEPLLAAEAGNATERAVARLQLVRGEIRALCTDFDAAESLANAALATFLSLGDRTGSGDAHWLLASIWIERGNRATVNAELDAALVEYRAVGDTLRIDAAVARKLALTAFDNAAQAQQGLAQTFPTEIHRHEAIEALVAMAHANVAALTDAPGDAIKWDLQAHQGARITGQIREAIVCACNSAEGFANLGDLDAALEWSERALAMARNTNWPASIGVCLMQVGDVLRQLSRHAEARNYLQESLGSMTAVHGSRNQGLVLRSLGQLALDVDEHAEALEIFLQLERGLGGPRDPDLLMDAARGQATSLSRLGRAREATAKATEALVLAREKGNSDAQVKALQVLAELHHNHDCRCLRA